MFFISRRESKDSYYVMDTDDGVEELLTYEDLIKAVVDKGIKIEGIKIRKTKQGYFKSLDCNICYNLLKSQPILKAATGVDIKEVNGYIVGITIKEDNDTRIKLSDYYKGVSFRALDNLESLFYPPKVVFIFDDKLDMPLEVLTQTEFIMVDITNLTNDKIAYNFYKYIPANYIVDKSERRAAFILDRVKDPNVLENLGIPKKDIQGKIEKTLKTMDKYFSTVKLVENNKLEYYYICNPKGIADYLKVNKEYLEILGYYIDYGVNDAKEIIYKLINRGRDELNMDFRFHSKFIRVLPKLGQI